ncbi:MAG TPA: ribonuclease E inhibitor RraB [Candidatus Dormibacteraeota bacterium]|nr:ribonuclease E inhibitor RraB [Candidatus Dormibacteraeota bacterium]
MAVKVGDLIEIRTNQGLAYAHVTHLVKGHGGPLIRVLEGFWGTRPVDLSALISSGTRFYTFFPVAPAVRQDMVTLIGNIPVEEPYVRFPLLRAFGPLPPMVPKVVWWLWDGEEEWRVGELTNDQRLLSIRSVIGFPLLVERIETGWRPQDLPWTDPDWQPPTSERTLVKSNHVSHMVFFIYFDDQAAATTAATNLSSGYRGLVEESAQADTGERPRWLLRISHADDGKSIDDADHELRQFAAKVGGNYDGWEAQIEAEQ